MGTSTLFSYPTPHHFSISNTFLSSFFPSVNFILFFVFIRFADEYLRPHFFFFFFFIHSSFFFIVRLWKYFFFLFISNCNRFLYNVHFLFRTHFSSFRDHHINFSLLLFYSKIFCQLFKHFSSLPIFSFDTNVFFFTLYILFYSYRWIKFCLVLNIFQIDVLSFNFFLIYFFPSYLFLFL